MDRIARTASTWLPPVAVMAAIFVFSSMPADDSDHGLLYVLSRKAAHFGGYALLAATWWRALRPKLHSSTAIRAAVAISTAYAVTDEVHQTFVPGRVGALTDVAIDTAGALAAAALIARRRQAVRA